MSIQKGIFKVCGKTGKIVGLNYKYKWMKWLFPLTGLLALIWYLVRVVPKPSRATYPCQKAAAPLAFSFLSYLVGILGAAAAFRNVMKFVKMHRVATAVICLAIGIACSAAVANINGKPVGAVENTGTFSPSDSANQPMGTARGIKPGRVAWGYDLSACNWNGSSNYWFSSQYNDQPKISKVMENVICSVANQPNVSSAWDALFKYKNGGDTGYVKGEKIAIKLNLNNGGNNDNQIDASPQTVYALLDQLVNKYGVNQSDIVLCDPARENQCSAIKSYCSSAFPNVNYNSSLGGWVSSAFNYSASGPVENSLSRAIVDSKYLITMAVLKRHCQTTTTWGDGFDYGNAGVTLIFKSNWGNIGSRRSSNHKLLHDWAYSMNSYNLLVDIHGSKHIDGKTVINIIDGLYSGDRWNSKPLKWQTAPFNNNYPSSIFASQDPVALESVGLDFLRSEMTLIKNADRHLHEASMANNPPSGTVYKPNGVQLKSLGVHEHWNNSTDKKYSRNLGTGNGIELVNVNSGSSPRGPDVNGDGAVNMADVIILATVFDARRGNPNFNESCDLNGDGSINMADVMIIATKFNTLV